ncbi:MAG: metallophosphoesterase [Armatimonadota bacterium]|nr:metallophosphoesterase [Armatimonadota bacterium]
MPQRIALIHTNDAHNRWNAAFVERLRTLKAQHHALLLDSGDCIRAGNLGIPLQPEPAWAWMQQAGYDAIALGNREFHLTVAGLLAKTRRAPAPLLCANLRPKQPDTPLPVQAVWQTVHAGVRVAVLGLTVPMITPQMYSAALSAYVFDPPIETARAWVARLRPEADLLIALTHIGITQDRLLAEACPELDVILGGHSHTPIHPPEQVNGVWISQSPPFCKGAVLLELERAGTRWALREALLVQGER